MKYILSPEIFVTESSDEIPSIELGKNESHNLTVEVDSENKYTSLNFSSRLAMYDFARALLQESIYGIAGQKEFYPLKIDGKQEVIDGVRMTSNSARLFVFYPNKCPDQTSK